MIYTVTETIYYSMGLSKAAIEPVLERRLGPRTFLRASKLIVTDSLSSNTVKKHPRKAILLWRLSWTNAHHEGQARRASDGTATAA
jgi:hypothetical protein